VVFVAGIATIVPSVIALIGGRGGSTRAGALGLSGLAIFVGASLGPLAADSRSDSPAYCSRSPHCSSAGQH
jgi:hypothetical protein